MSRSLILTLVICITLIPSAQPITANGCSVIHETPTPTVTERTTAAPLVLEGTVLAVTGENYAAIATIQVRQYLKGSGPEVVQIHGFHEFWTLYECPDWVRVGDHLIFYAEGEPGRALHTFVVGKRGSTTTVSTGTLDEAVTAAGQKPVTPYVQLDEAATAAGQGPVTPYVQTTASTITTFQPTAVRVTPEITLTPPSVTPTPNNSVLATGIFIGAIILAVIGVIAFAQNKKVR